jgi:hypothetical protein
MASRASRGTAARAGSGGATTLLRYGR